MSRAAVARVFVISLMLVLAGTAFAQDFEASLVTVRVTTQAWDHYSPWRKRAPLQAEIQGCVLPGGRILTLAPPLADHVQVEVTKHGSPRRYPAEVALKDYTAGLAILTVSDPQFFADLQPVTLAEAGKPAGQLRAARWEPGGVLREFTASLVKTAVDYPPPAGVTLAHYLATEMDRGGFGESVFADGKLVGVAYQLEAASRNLKVHSVEVIRRLLADLADGRYEGYPTGWEYARGLDGDPALKAYLGLHPDETGILVTAVPPRLTGAGLLERDDVILAIDGTPIDDAGMFRSAVYGQLRYEALLFLPHMSGDLLRLRILRAGVRLELDLPMLPATPQSFLVPLVSADTRPSYLVFGGLVFQELTRAYLQSAWGGDWRRAADSRLLYLYETQALFPTPPRSRIVLLNRVLPHAANAGYQSDANLVLVTLDGTPIADLAHLRRLLAEGTGYADFEFMGSERVVLSRERATEARAEIRELYGLPESDETGEP